MIDSIILDFGNVLYEVDIYAAKYNFQKLRINQSEPVKIENVEKIIYDYECGRFTTEDFRSKITNEIGLNCSNEEFDKAWNSILIDVFPFAEEAIDKLSKKYKLYLLSNTSQLHYELFYPQMKHIFDKFEKLYFSHLVGFRKPNPRIYEYMLRDSGISPSNAIFADDLAENLEAFEKFGVSTVLIKKEFSLKNFSDKMLN